MPNFSAIPPPLRLAPGRRLSASRVNGLFNAVHGARGGDPDTLVELRVDGLRISSRKRRSPFRKIYIRGVEVTATGGFSGATPYLWVDVAASTAAWKANTVAPMPDSVEIHDGRLSTEGELHVSRFG